MPLGKLLTLIGLVQLFSIRFPVEEYTLNASIFGALIVSSSSHGFGKIVACISCSLIKIGLKVRP
tara:strand:- start:1433 stop:1627 length:195 start_codon:yes stop_codon:yes gene_type:complete